MGRHRKMRAWMGRPADRALQVLLLAGLFAGLAGPAVAGVRFADASAVRPAAHARVLPYALGYKSHQLLCTRQLRGEYAVVTGDGRPFVVRCDQDGPPWGARAWVWDAQ